VQQPFLWSKYAKTVVHTDSISVIQDVLPGVDTTPIKKGWEDATARYGIKLASYKEISDVSSDCGAQFHASAAPRPGFIYMPIAAPPFLACMRSAKTAAAQPGSPTSSWLKAWHGGSGLQIEVDNCKPTCEGMVTGTLFNDPRSDQNPNMVTYRKNMAKYAPDIDLAGFIAVNYYHNGPTLYAMEKQANL